MHRAYKSECLWFSYILCINLRSFFRPIFRSNLPMGFKQADWSLPIFKRGGHGMQQTSAHIESRLELGLELGLGHGKSSSIDDPLMSFMKYSEDNVLMKDTTRISKNHDIWWYGFRNQIVILSLVLHQALCLGTFLIVGFGFRMLRCHWTRGCFVLF